MGTIGGIIYQVIVKSQPGYKLEIQAVYEGFLEAVNQEKWDEMVNFYSDKRQEDMGASFASENSSYRNIISAELYSMLEMSLDYLPGYLSSSDKFEGYEEWKLYLIGIDMSVKQVTTEFYNGINYTGVLFGKQNGEWKILGGPANSVRDMIGDAFMKSRNPKETFALNVALIHRLSSRVLIDGDGTVIEGSEEEIKGLNDYLREFIYPVYGREGIYLETR